MTYEDAYYGERPQGSEVLARLVSELQRSTDSYTRGKFAELLGEMGDESIVDVLLAELSHSEPDVRNWAVLALERLGSARSLAAAATHRSQYPHDFD